MPRKPRVEFEGAVYHVMCRGDHREPIVQDDVDRAEFRHCLGGAAVAERDRRTAEELLAAALDAVGLSACDLSRLRKDDARKQAVAWLLRKHTTVRNRWLSEQLAMGHETRISQSVPAVAQAEGGELARLRQALQATPKITD